MTDRPVPSRPILPRIMVALFLLMAALSLVATALSVVLDYGRSPIDPQGGASPVVFEIPKGTHFRDAVTILREKGLVKKGVLFHVLARFRDAPNHIRAGEYEITMGGSPDALLKKLLRGEIKGYRMPFPEGFTIRQVAERLSQWGLVDYEGFIARCHDPVLLEDLGIQGGSVEGYLYPETYIFTRSMGEEEIIRHMVREFRKRQRPEWKKEAEKRSLTLEEIIVMASMIEKEASLPEEKPLISAVFHNRLKRGMRLQSDPTVIYGLTDFDGNIKKSHLRQNTPYNTYVHEGLPPGPICNPGETSIEAALRPAPVPYLYFVARNDGTHHFSTTLSHHREAVIKYQIRKEK